MSGRVGEVENDFGKGVGRVERFVIVIVGENDPTEQMRSRSDLSRTITRRSCDESVVKEPKGKTSRDQPRISSRRASECSVLYPSP